MMMVRLRNVIIPAVAAGVALSVSSSSSLSCASALAPKKITSVAAAAQMDALIIDTTTTSASLLSQADSFAETFENDPNVLWRSARSYYQASKSSKLLSASERVSLLRRAIHLLSAARARGVTRDSSSAHRWEGIVKSELSSLVTSREAAKLAWDVKTHFSDALAIDAGDANAAHLYGRWARAISEIPEWKRSILFALTGEELPRSSHAEACEYFARAERIDPSGWCSNLAALASCKEKSGDFKEAVAFARTALATSNVNRDVETIIEAENVLKRVENRIK